MDRKAIEGGQQQGPLELMSRLHRGDVFPLIRFSFLFAPATVVAFSFIILLCPGFTFMFSSSRDDVCDCTKCMVVYGMDCSLFTRYYCRKGIKFIRHMRESTLPYFPLLLQRRLPRTTTDRHEQLQDLAVEISRYVLSDPLPRLPSGTKCRPMGDGRVVASTSSGPGSVR